MFIGEYQHTMDKKGRINVPAKFREILGASFIMTKSLDGCITVYHQDDFKNFEQKFKEIPFSNEIARKFTRYFFSNAVECEPDSLGRISIPQNLREHAGLEKDVVTIGARDKVEIWDKARWDSETESISNEEIAEMMGRLGI